MKRHLGKALEIFSDVLQHPVFPEAELDRQRNMALGRLVQVRNEPTALAALAVNQTIYGYDHPYGQPGQGTSSSLKSITRNDLKNFHQAAADPRQATIIAVGDTTLEEITRELEKVFSGWKNPGKTSETKFSPPADRAGGDYLDRQARGRAVGRCHGLGGHGAQNARLFPALGDEHRPWADNSPAA